MTQLNFELIKGDTLCFGAKVTGVESIENVFFSCKKNLTDPDYVFQKSNAEGGGIDLVESGTYRVRIAPEDTRELETGTYFYDLQISENGDVYTILQGQLVINEEITKEW